MRALLKAVGLIDEAQIKAKAFERLCNRLFLIGWIEGVAAHGFARSLEPNSLSEITILLLVLEPPPHAQDEIDTIVHAVNVRFGTLFKSVLVKQGSFDFTRATAI